MNDLSLSELLRAERVFRSMLRLLRAVGIPLSRALRRANEITFQKTGVDVLEEIGSVGEDPVADAEALENNATVAQPDTLIINLTYWVYGQTELFTAKQAAVEGLGMNELKLDKSVMTRIGIALNKLGCRRKEIRNNPIDRYWYEPPKKS